MRRGRHHAFPPEADPPGADNVPNNLIPNFYRHAAIV